MYLLSNINQFEILVRFEMLVVFDLRMSWVGSNRKLLIWSSLQHIRIKAAFRMRLNGSFGELTKRIYCVLMWLVLINQYSVLPNLRQSGCNCQLCHLFILSRRKYISWWVGFHIIVVKPSWHTKWRCFCYKLGPFSFK